MCSDCGANYSVVDNPPRIPGICDVCGGEVVQRDDDTESAIRRRLELYERETAPLIEWFDKKALLATVNGMGSPDEVTSPPDRRGGPAQAAGPVAVGPVSQRQVAAATGEQQRLAALRPLSQAKRFGGGDDQVLPDSCPWAAGS